MPWTVNFLEDRKVVETKFTGDLEPIEVRDAVVASLDIATKNDTYLYLADCTRLKESGSLLDIYELGKFIETLAPDRKIKEAVIIPKTNRAVGDLKFYETLTVNRGFNVRLFEEREEGLQWLVS
jgi:hypothetical protein